MGRASYFQQVVDCTLQRVGHTFEVEQFTKPGMATSAQIVDDLLGLRPSVTTSPHRHLQYLPC